MTKQRAAEIILGGVTVVDCSRCDGFGKERLSVTVGEITCRKCKGSKQQIKANYMKACKKMGIKQPLQPWVEENIERLNSRLGRASTWGVLTFKECRGSTLVVNPEYVVACRKMGVQCCIDDRVVPIGSHD